MDNQQQLQQRIDATTGKIVRCSATNFRPGEASDQCLHPPHGKEVPHLFASVEIGKLIHKACYERLAGLEREVADAKLYAAQCREALQGLLRFFGKYPEWKPNPEMLEDVERAILAAQRTAAGEGK